MASPGLWVFISLVLLVAAVGLFLIAPKLDKVAWWLFGGWAVTALVAGYLVAAAWWGILVALVLAVAVLGALSEAVLKSSFRVARLFEMLSDPDIQVRLRALTAAAACKENGVDALAQGLWDKEWEVRQHAAVCLGGTESNDAIPVLRQALKDSSQAVREAAAASLAMLGAEAASEEWLATIARLRAVKAKEAYTFLALKAPPLPGLASKLGTIFLVGLVTGSGNVGALAAMSDKSNAGDALRLPENCCLCGLQPGEKPSVVEKTVTASRLGMVVGGPVTGQQKVALEVKLCPLCAKESSLAPGVEILEYEELEEGWTLQLGFLNEKVAEQFRTTNPGRVLAG